MRNSLVSGLVCAFVPALLLAGAPARAAVHHPAVHGPTVQGPTVHGSAGQRPAREPTHLLPTCGAESSDVDGDGLCDRLERATGTDPYDADSDGDGVPDGVEDANQDGRRDEGESDPRVPGLFPGSVPHIPEPLLFDLVRGLGASQGELEANALVVAVFDRRGRPSIEWAPEIEWAIGDGVAVELELPMEREELSALKGAVQVTLPGGDERFAHGVQGIAEYVMEEKSTQGSVLYIIGARASSWSVLSMIGGRRFLRADSAPTQVLLNPSVFFDASEAITLGLETNVAAAPGTREVRAIPQVHYQVSKHVRIQLGAGVQFASERRGPLVTTRIVLE